MVVFYLQLNYFPMIAMTVFILDSRRLTVLKNVFLSKLILIVFSIILNDLPEMRTESSSKIPTIKTCFNRNLNDGRRILCWKR